MTVYGGTVLRLIAAATKIPVAVQVGQLQAREPHGTRALVTQARAHLAGAARLSKVVCEKGGWAGTDLGWLDPPGLRCAVPAQAQMAVTAVARAQAAAGEGLTRGRRVHTVRQGPGKTAWTARQATAVVGITGLTTDEQEGTPENTGARRLVVMSRATSSMPGWYAHGRDGTPGPGAQPSS